MARLPSPQSPSSRYASETFAYRGAEWHRKAANGVGFIYDVDTVVADIGDTGISRFYVTPMLDQNVSLTVTGGDQAGSYFYSQDERQSVRTLTDSSGTVVARYDYTAFGEPVACSPSPVVQQRYTYTGRELNPYSGNFAFRYRTYGPGAGIFAARDPLGYVDGMGLYGGVFAAVMQGDPLGLGPSSPQSKCQMVKFRSFKIGAQSPAPPPLTLFVRYEVAGRVEVRYTECEVCCETGPLAGKAAIQRSVASGLDIEGKISAGIVNTQVGPVGVWLGLRGVIYGKITGEAAVTTDPCSGHGWGGKQCVTGTFGGRLEGGGEAAYSGGPIILTVGLRGYVFAEAKLRGCLDCTGDNTCRWTVDAYGRYGWGFEFSGFWLSMQYERSTESCKQLYTSAPFRL